MQPVENTPLKLIIRGSFWDSQIYMGKLYLWTRDGSIIVYQWDRMIESLAADKPTQLAVTCAFMRSDYLYGSQWSLVFSDRDVVALLQQKFLNAATKTLEPSEKVLQACRVGEQANPFPFPHSDATIYNKGVFVGTHKGLFRAGCGGGTLHPISTRPKKLWDGSSTGISANYRAMAIAAGSDGLFQVPLLDAIQNDDATQKDPLLVSAQHASSCEWVYWSIYASSHVSGGYLADYSRFEQVADDDRYSYGVSTSRHPKNIREIRDVLPAKQIFKGGTNYTWGARDKLCSAKQNMVDVCRYQPWKESTAIISKLGNVPNKHLGAPDQLIAARTASFGVVLERDDELLVIDSTMREHRIQGAPVNWRIFPRSIHYENHLHVVYDDRLEVLSFNHDYFVDQDQKLLGSRQTVQKRRS